MPSRTLCSLRYVASQRLFYKTLVLFRLESSAVYRRFFFNQRCVSIIIIVITIIASLCKIVARDPSPVSVSVEKRTDRTKSTARNSQIAIHGRSTGGVARLFIDRARLDSRTSRAQIILRSSVGCTVSVQAEIADNK